MQIMAAFPPFEQSPLLEKSFSLTQTKVKKYALAALGVLASLASCASLSFVLAGLASYPFALFTIPFFYFAKKALSLSESIKDYEDPFQLQRMQEEARFLSFLELREEHFGIENVLFYKVMTPSELRSKFWTEYETLCFSQIIRQYPLTYIKRYGLMTDKQLKNRLYLELSELKQLSDVLERFGRERIEELERFKILSSEEAEKLHSLCRQIELFEEESLKQDLEIHLHYLGRREHILEELDKKLNSLENKKESFETKVLVFEKVKIESDPSIGRSLQNEYEAKKKACLEERQLLKRKIFEELSLFLQLHF
jgi:hypothetical protein